MNFAFLREPLRNLRWPRPRRDDRLRLGRRGERAAARYLKRRQHHILVRNYRCGAGEIDLICSDGDTIVFVEVKTRFSEAVEHPQISFRAGQPKRIENAARYFLMQRGAQNRPCRFDLVTVVWPPRGSPEIEHFRDAFQAQRA